jgi:hypothetical protein
MTVHAATCRLVEELSETVFCWSECFGVEGEHIGKRCIFVLEKL